MLPRQKTIQRATEILTSLGDQTWAEIRATQDEEVSAAEIPGRSERVLTQLTLDVAEWWYSHHDQRKQNVQAYKLSIKSDFNRHFANQFDVFRNDLPAHAWERAGKWLDKDFEGSLEYVNRRQEVVKFCLGRYLAEVGCNQLRRQDAAIDWSRLELDAPRPATPLQGKLV